VTRVERDGTVRYRVRYRLGGRETPMLAGGSFKTMREAKARRDAIAGELSARRVPDLRLLAELETTALLSDVAEAWRQSRLDGADGTAATASSR
jgi:hypothetical protein